MESGFIPYGQNITITIQERIVEWMDATVSLNQLSQLVSSDYAQGNPSNEVSSGYLWLSIPGIYDPLASVAFKVAAKNLCPSRVSDRPTITMINGTSCDDVTEKLMLEVNCSDSNWRLVEVLLNTHVTFVTSTRNVSYAATGAFPLIIFGEVTSDMRSKICVLLYTNSHP